MLIGLKAPLFYSFCRAVVALRKGTNRGGGLYNVITKELAKNKW